MDALGTIIQWMIGLWLVSKLLPPFVEGIQRGMHKGDMNNMIRQHPEHANAIRNAMAMGPASWEVKKFRSGGGAGKWIMILLCAIYIISPLDFIPDVIPGLGWGDDIVAGLIGLRALMK
jgi:uncharacterized membrane protein YkvA (DUF1232 family)